MKKHKTNITLISFIFEYLSNTSHNATYTSDNIYRKMSEYYRSFSE